ncbi:MAG: prolipoprotein diacylglyceryl transferase, partial [Acutalibacteraceae bacterium]|nr:prolipoprotein diacylglyceryl transferase [Acutalibacteraceae bacterium]
MHDTVEVFFNGLSGSMNVSSILADFNLFGADITIRWYGAIIAFGFLLAVLFGGRMAYKWKISLDKMLDVLIYGTIFGIIGARLYYCIFKWDLYKDNPLDIFAIWEGGLAIYGGIIGGLAAAFVVCKVRKMNFWNLLDMASMSLLIGQGIGRWGNFANQEAFGTNTD